MIISRRSILRMLLASPIAATLDVESLIWTPRQMIVVPEMPQVVHVDLGRIVALEWEKLIKSGRLMNLFERDDTFYRELSKHFLQHEKMYYAELKRKGVSDWD